MQYRRDPLRDPARVVSIGTNIGAALPLCQTHLDQLADKLREPYARRVIELLLSRGDGHYSDTDREYVRDLGLVAPGPPLRIANPIYGEVLPRELTWVLQDQMPQRADGRLHGHERGRHPCPSSARWSNTHWLVPWLNGTAQ